MTTPGKIGGPGVQDQIRSRQKRTPGDLKNSSLLDELDLALKSDISINFASASSNSTYNSIYQKKKKFFGKKKNMKMDKVSVVKASFKRDK